MLVADPADLGEYGRVLGELLDDAPRREAMGAAARARVEDHFLGTRHLLQYFGLLRDLLQRQADAGK
jgi:trehalose synthase